MAKNIAQLNKENKEYREQLEAIGQELEEKNKAMQQLELLTQKLQALEERFGNQYQQPLQDSEPPMTEQRKKELNKYYMERIPVKFFKDNENYKDDITTIYRGKVYNLKRGIRVMIPRGLFYALEDAERQKAVADRMSAAYEEAYTRSFSQLN